jgi:hypothetical protein
MKTITRENEEWFIEHCNFDPETDDANTFCIGCPLTAECLYYYTGDDSELPADSEWRNN